MHCLVVYDIPDDKKRAKVADACLDYGLDRFQYSAFVGVLAPLYQDELMLKLERVLGRKEANIQLFPVCAKDWRARQVIDNSE